MSPALKIAREITRLPLEDMMALHEELISVIHEREEGEGLDTVYVKEIRRRVAEIESGKIKGIPAEKVFKKLKKKYA
jgi:putative addiction module component (TIGR02574 family)